MERLVAAARADLAEQFQGAALGGGGEREERQVGLVAPGGHRFGQQRLGVGRLHIAVGLDVGFGRAQDAAELLGRFAGLRRVGLVDDHRVVALGQRLDPVEHERKLLQRGDDDAGLLAGQGLSQLRRGLVDALHHPGGMLELADGVLELAVEHHPVGDDYNLVEHLGVVGGVQR